MNQFIMNLVVKHYSIASYTTNRMDHVRAQDFRDASPEEDKSMRFYLVSLESFYNQVPTSSLMHHYYAILPFFYILLLYYYIQGLHP